MTLTKLVIILLIALVVISFIFVLSLVNMHNKHVDAIERKNKEISELNKALANAIEEKLRIEQNYKKKKEVSDETKQNIANIASGTTADSAERLQKPRSRKSKTANSNS